MARRAELPAAARVAKVQVAAEDAGAAVAAYVGVLDMRVIDAIGEVAGKRGGVDPLVEEMAGVKVEPEGRAAIDRLERALSSVVIESDLCGMHLQPEPDTTLVELIEDGIPAFSEELEALLDERFVLR